MSVPAVGPTPNSVLLFGKAPGREEISAGRPFVGKAGREHKSYCDRHSLRPYSWRVSNLCRDYIPPDERLSSSLLSLWEPDILQEIERTRPRLIIAVGGDPTKYFLGQSANLSTVHGLPHKPGSFDPSVAYRAPKGCCILPIYQPAAGFHSSETRALIDWDYSQIGHILELIHREVEIPYRFDPYEGKEQYYDVSGRDLACILSFDAPPLLSLDTEGIPSDPFSLQITLVPGSGYMLRVDREDFSEGVNALRSLADSGTIFTGHNIGMYDLEVCRRMGLDLFHANVHDTPYDCFLFGIEPLGLKAQGWRQLGVRMKSHNETVGELGRELQIDYLQRALDLCADWPKPDPIFKLKNDGNYEIKKPNTLASRIRKILADIETQSLSEEDVEDQDESDPEEALSGVDPFKRWRAVKRDLADTVKRVEHEIGRMPTASMRMLYDRDPDSAIHYGCKDSDVSRQLYHPFIERLKREDKLHLAEIYSQTMHVFSEMQENGMPTRRSLLESLRDRLTDEMTRIVALISHDYNGGRSYNPKSSPQTGELFERWGLRGTKQTKAKKPSYGKKSIEHLRFTDDSMSEDEKWRRRLVALRLEWGQNQHTRDMFCTPTLALLPEDVDECTARGQILPWGTHTRRNAMKRPNLLAQPKHSKWGKWIRECYIAPEGYVFLESDLASIEVCVMAHESGDANLIAALNGKIKFHRVTGSRVFGVKPEDVDDTQYTVSKRVIFGTFYGQTGPGLKEQLWMQNLTQFDDEKCQAFIDAAKYEVYPGIGRYETKIENELRKTGTIRDFGGMERKLPGIWSEDRGVRQEAVRHAVSQKIQGGAQTLLQNSIAWLKDEIRALREDSGIDVKWRLTIHDSLLLTCPEWAAEIVREKVEEGLTKQCGKTLRVPVKAESKTAQTWGGL